MPAVLHHVALIVAALGLGQAALHVATAITPSGLERVIAAVSLAAATIVVETLALGLLGLGGSTVALVAATAATWAATMVLLPRPERQPSAELAGWWEGLRGLGRVAVAAISGAGAAWVAWQLRNPSIGFDSSLYHYPFVAGWIANGEPGSALTLSYEIPYGSYPLTDEVALTWGAAIARSWAPLALWTPALLVVLTLASWLTLRNLSIARPAAGLATAGLVAAPLLVRQLNEPQTDLPAMAWLACTAGLATAAHRRPALLAPAVVAAGLAIGTKPSTAPLAVAALGVGAYLARGRLRPLLGWLALGLAGAFVVGGVWYARNLIEHGSPLWPFIAAPWGEPSPRFIALVDSPFLASPIATLEGRLGQFSARLGGGWLVLAGAVAVLVYAALASRLQTGLRRPVLVSGALAVAALLLWSTAWGSGLPTAPELGFREGFSLSALRYMSPGIGVATIAVALATRVRGFVGAAATGLLAVALAWSVIATARLGAPWTPPASDLLLGALAGVAVVVAAAILARPLRQIAYLVPAAAGVLLGVLAVSAVLTAAGNGFIERYSRLDRTTAYGADLVSWFLEQPGFADGDQTIAIASRGVLGQLAGDRFRHRLRLAPQLASCAELERLARKMPVVVTPPGYFRGLLGLEDYSAPRCFARHRPVFRQGSNAVYRLGS